jgi:hypothetical protein
MVDSGGDSMGLEAKIPAVISGYDDVYEGYNDFDPQIADYGHANPSPQVSESESMVRGPQDCWFSSSTRTKPTFS